MYLGEFIAAAVDMFKIPFTLFGVTFSMWQVFLFSIVGSIIIWIIGEIFG